MSNELIGKKIICMKIAADKEAILFIADSGENMVVKVDADCCSHTWIESIEMPALGLPFTITAIEDLDMGKESVSDDKYECLQFYGAKIVTDKGDMIIDYRNESNGYYGGSICWPGDRFYGGVYSQNTSKEEWIDIQDAGVMTTFLLGWLALAITLTAAYSLMRSRQKRREMIEFYGVFEA